MWRFDKMKKGELPKVAARGRYKKVILKKRKRFDTMKKGETAKLAALGRCKKVIPKKREI